ncbi:glycosyltransferase [uncultured Winogradskyella sp.]|uniref:glycosyltransferase n=1 Tax=uncultured Winogradskyella sp. TaxID=395353 RepID=UPI00262EB1E8|nr:glycosyltransferase [uncultured Winogradskyella sp.]
MSQEYFGNILIIGPFGDFGGRELETSFIAQAVEDNAKVCILSTSYCTEDSQLFDFINSVSVESVDNLLYKRSFLFRVFSLLIAFKNGNKKKSIEYLHNKLNKKFGLKRASKKILENYIDKNDIIVLCAQISSNFMKEIVIYSKLKHKQIVFRTTNLNTYSTEHRVKWLESVDLFLHHSETNANRLNFLENHNYQLIDQCAFSEEEYLKIPYKNRINTFLAISRIESEKNIDVLIDVFKLEENRHLHLNIVGKGSALEQLKRRAASYENINFIGFVPNHQLVDCFKANDSFIVSYYEGEAGPLTGMEAMACGMVIVSAKTGAMPERLPNSDFFFDNKIEDLNKTIQKLKLLSTEAIKTVSKNNRNRYLKNYQINHLKNQYKSAIFSFYKDRIV